MTPLAVENSVGKPAAPREGARLMSARERELGELPSPDLSLLDRKVGRGLFVSINALVGVPVFRFQKKSIRAQGRRGERRGREQPKRPGQ
jgi:hypothetical protein